MLDSSHRLSHLAFSATRLVTMPAAHPWPNLRGIHVASLRFDGLTPEPSLLRPDERAIFDTLTSERRRLEWWAGRMTARSALGPKGAAAASVVADAKGAPLIRGALEHLARVSLSHGRRLAAAAATRRDEPWPHAGIDVVDPEDIERIRKLSARVLKPAEQERAKVLDPTFLQLAWGAREAIAKATRTGMFAYALLHVSVLDFGDGLVEVDHPETKVAYERTETGELLVVAGLSESAFEWAQKRALDERT